MSYLAMAYVVGIGLLGGYVVKMWIESQALKKQERRHGAGED